MRKYLLLAELDRINRPGVGQGRLSQGRLSTLSWGASGFTSADLRTTAVDLVGPSANDEFQQWFVRTLETTEELDYREALDWFGVSFRSPSSARTAYLGVATTADNGRTVVSRVTRGTPAFEAGFDVDDEIVAINDLRVPAGELGARIAQFRPGEKVTVTITRREVTRRLDVTLGTAPTQSWALIARPDATSDQIARLKDWLGN